MNGYEQCFPAHDRCPSGYHSHEDDETGEMYSGFSVPCDPGYIITPDFPECEYKNSVCQKTSCPHECKVDEVVMVQLNTPAYNSGFSHGCSDAKISNSSKRYINQPGKGTRYHTTRIYEWIR